MKNIVLQSAAASVRAQARIQNFIYETPLLKARVAGIENHARVFFKAENFQKTGSFKIRGAVAKMTAMQQGQKFITASSGNHGIAAACASSELKHDLTVVLPENVIVTKLKKIKSYGVNVVLHGVQTGAAELYAAALAEKQGYDYISPYNDSEIIAGQGTIGLELLKQNQDIDTVFIAMGGGGLISGIGAVLKNFFPTKRIVGVAAENSQALACSMKAGKVVETAHFETLADAVAGGIDDNSLTLPLALEVVDEVIICNEVEIAHALQQLAFEENMVVEGAAALALAGFNKQAKTLKGKTSVVLLCGANYDEACIRKVLSL